jgi:hypothetical protein
MPLGPLKPLMPLGPLRALRLLRLTLLLLHPPSESRRLVCSVTAGLPPWLRP